MNDVRVLVVDDDQDLLSILSIRLKRSGYRVITATNGRAALAEIPAFNPHVVITDLRMDGLDGLALLEEIKALQPTLSVIMLTAHGTIPEAVAATHAGVFAFLTKPFDPESLLQQVDAAAAIAGAGSSSHPGEEATDWRAEIVTRSAVMEDLLRQARLAARSDVSIIIQSQSGTGKELLAKAIHRASRRREHHFVPVNCTAIPESLFESELFGYRKGAFSGATHDRDGLFQTANRGTLFLDEIGDMPLHFQAKLLRAIQEQEVRPVGAQQSVPVDVRIIAATHQDLDAAVAEGRFREDLFYRLNVVVLELPPLAGRREDIPLLIDRFLSGACADGPMRHFSPAAQARLLAAPWPGNIRQLRNIVEQCVVLCDAPVIPEALVERALRGRAGKLPSLNEARDKFDREYLLDLMRITSGNVSHAARLAGRNRSEFYSLLSRHAIDPASFRRTTNNEDPCTPA